MDGFARIIVMTKSEYAQEVSEILENFNWEAYEMEYSYEIEGHKYTYGQENEWWISGSVFEEFPELMCNLGDLLDGKAIACGMSQGSMLQDIWYYGYYIDEINNGYDCIDSSDDYFDESDIDWDEFDESQSSAQEWFEYAIMHYIESDGDGINTEGLKRLEEYGIHISEEAIKAMNSRLKKIVTLEPRIISVVSNKIIGRRKYGI